MKIFRFLMTLFVVLLGASSGVAAPCPNPGVTPKTFPDGVVVRPYSLTNLSTTPDTVEACIFLQNTSVVTVPFVTVDSQLEEPSTGVPGPWALLSSSSINISGGVSVTCSNTSTVATTAATAGSLAPGAATDICCFVWEEDPMGSGCSALPSAGDLVRHTSAPGDVVIMPMLSYISVGGTTCGLVSLELLLLLPLLRLARGRARS